MKPKPTPNYLTSLETTPIVMNSKSLTGRRLIKSFHKFLITSTLWAPQEIPCTHWAKLHFLLLAWQHYSVKSWTISEISKQKFGINSHIMFLIWAKYGPNILSIVLHYLHFICLTLFGEILSLSGIKKHKFCEIAKTSTNMVSTWPLQSTNNLTLNDILF